MPDHPENGDVLVMSEAGRYCVSIIPHPHRITFGTLADASELASQLARREHVKAWRRVDDETVRIPLQPGALRRDS